MRRLYLNLKDKKNPGLRAGVVSGEIAVERFCKMSAEVSLEMITIGRVLILRRKWRARSENKRTARLISRTFITHLEQASPRPRLMRSSAGGARTCV
jgi:hypothetical protein